MTTIKDALSFMKRHKTSGVWLENGICKLIKDSCDGYSDGLELSTTMFQFFESCNLLKENSYSGFKAIRIFDNNIQKNSTKLTELEELYSKYKENKRKQLKKEIVTMKTIVSLSYEKQTQQYFIEKLDKLKIKNFSICSPQNYNTGRVTIGSRSVRYLGWRTNKILSLLKNEIERSEKLLLSEDYSEFISAFDYERSPLPFHLEKQLKLIA